MTERNYYLELDDLYDLENSTTRLQSAGVWAYTSPMKRYVMPEKDYLENPGNLEAIEFILKSRGIETSEKHLDLTFEDIESPYKMGGVEKAIHRILEAVKHKERIMIAGDYDCDGICSTITLWRYFKSINIDVDVAIPNRHTQGYGFHNYAVDEAHAKGVSLIITVDVGIKCHETIEYAKTFGIDVIVTDHHEASSVLPLPSAYAVVNPKLGTGDTMLCGASVAWQLGRAMYDAMRESGNTEIKEGAEKWFLDLVCIATIGDQVPLKNQNRIFAMYGFKVLQKTKLIGLTSLLYYSKIKNLSFSDISFSLVPLINSASRMEHAHVAIQLFLSQNPDEADVLARKIVALNQARKLETAKVVKSIEKKKDILSKKNIIVVGDKKWHLGVVGIIAGKIVDMFEVPVFVWAVDEEGVVRGSCRSVPGISVVEILESTSQHLISFGGHHMAAGFALSKENLITWITDVENFLTEKKVAEIIEEIDFIISKKSHIKKVVDIMKIIEPCGQDFKAPLVSTIPAKIIQYKTFGGDSTHYEIFIETATDKIRGVWFYGDEKKIETKKNMRMIGSAEYDNFRNEYVLFVRDIIEYNE